MTAFNQLDGNRGSSAILVCPNCEFENPTHNKFCQKCGTLLEMWWAQMVKGEGEPIAPTSPIAEVPAVDRVPAETEVSEEVIPSPGDGQEAGEDDSPSDPAIDPQHRYRIYKDDLQRWESWKTVPVRSLQVHLWDSNPSQKTFLEILLEEHEDALSELERSDILSPSVSSEFWDRMGVPAIARPYLVLQESYSPAVPLLRDTWSYGGCELILLEDRQHWSLLVDHWGDEQNSLLQLLCWIDEMVKLWQGLATVGCCQSLLEENNLRLDEDQSLCIQQLYRDPPDREPTLQDLGKMWQKLFGRSGRTLYDPLPQFLEMVRQGKLTNPEEVRTRLQAIASNGESPIEEEIEVAQSDIDPVAAPSPSAKPSENIAYRSVADDTPTVVLPMQLLSLDDVGYTDIGSQRDHNEDCFGIATEIEKEENPFGRNIHVRSLYVVCDGMGGHAAGEVASAMAVESLQQYFKTHWLEGGDFPDRDVILEAILTANQKLYEVNQQNERSGSGRMGTTLVMALVEDTKVAIAHVGDSRIYRITRKQGLKQLTTDHEVGQREIKRGVEPAVAYARPDAYQLTQALGPRSNNSVKPDINFLDINEDTLLLLCSDGLSDNDLIETHFQTYLTPLISSKANIDQGLQELMDFANHHNGHDNITGLLVRLKVRPNTDSSRS